MAMSFVEKQPKTEDDTVVILRQVMYSNPPIVDEFVKLIQDKGNYDSFTANIKDNLYVMNGLNDWIQENGGTVPTNVSSVTIAPSSNLLTPPPPAYPSPPPIPVISQAESENEKLDKLVKTMVDGFNESPRAANPTKDEINRLCKAINDLNAGEISEFNKKFDVEIRKIASEEEGNAYFDWLEANIDDEVTRVNYEKAMDRVDALSEQLDDDVPLSDFNSSNKPPPPPPPPPVSTTKSELVGKQFYDAFHAGSFFPDKKIAGEYIDALEQNLDPNEVEFFLNAIDVNPNYEAWLAQNLEPEAYTLKKDHIREVSKTNKNNIVTTMMAPPPPPPPPLSPPPSTKVTGLGNPGGTGLVARFLAQSDSPSAQELADYLALVSADSSEMKLFVESTQKPSTGFNNWLTSKLTGDEYKQYQIVRGEIWGKYNNGNMSNNRNMSPPPPAPVVGSSSMPPLAPPPSPTPTAVFKAVVYVATTSPDAEKIKDNFDAVYKKPSNSKYIPPRDESDGSVTLTFPPKTPSYTPPMTKEAFFEEQAKANLPFIIADRKTNEVLAYSTGTDGKLYTPDGKQYVSGAELKPTGIQCDQAYIDNIATLMPPSASGPTSSPSI